VAKWEELPLYCEGTPACSRQLEAL